MRTGCKEIFYLMIIYFRFGLTQHVTAHCISIYFHFGLEQHVAVHRITIYFCFGLTHHVTAHRITILFSLFTLGWGGTTCDSSSYRNLILLWVVTWNMEGDGEGCKTH